MHETLRRLILLSAGLFCLSACQSKPIEQDASPKLLTSINSQERMALCANDWGGAKTKEFAQCLRGEKYTRNEFCAFAGGFLNHEYASDWQKAAVYEKMQNYGCMQ